MTIVECILELLLYALRLSVTQRHCAFNQRRRSPRTSCPSPRCAL